MAKSTKRSTKLDLLLAALKDRRWHSTEELAHRRVGHTFGVAKFKLVSYGYSIEKRRHPTKPHQWQYRLLDEEAR